MLTRLKVSGFKNLVDVDVRFGPFTCIAGANGTGKSNLFDAIRFLSALSDRPLMDAALSVRGENTRTRDVRSIFHHVGNNYDNEMSFEVEMIVPYEGVDDLGQQATASITFLRYSLVIAYQGADDVTPLGNLKLNKEELMRINLKEAPRHLQFHNSTLWRKSALKGRRASPFISTDGMANSQVIKLHQDGRKGQTLSRLATNLPRTVLSVSNAAESPTALLAKREMQSWRLLQLEPSSLRKPDEFNAPGRLGTDGSHLPATLFRLAGQGKNGIIYGQVVNRLSELIEGIHEVVIERDERRELLTLMVTDRDKTRLPAQALSDGTLRFLALTILELDPESHGLICLEEPENGIHPERIPSMLRLLQDITTDVNEKVGSDNPLRQVIVNTHSPTVVAQVPDESLLVAELKEKVKGEQRFTSAHFSFLSNTWRAKGPDSNLISKGKLLAYLNPIQHEAIESELGTHQGGKILKPARGKRVADREDLQMLIPFPKTGNE